MEAVLEDFRDKEPDLEEETEVAVVSEENSVFCDEVGAVVDLVETEDEATVVVVVVPRDNAVAWERSLVDTPSLSSSDGKSRSSPIS